MKASARRIMETPEAALERIAAGKRGRVTGWGVPTVEDALTDAFRVLRKMPDRTRQKTLKSYWPDDTFAKMPELIEAEAIYVNKLVYFDLGEDEYNVRAEDRMKAIVVPSSHEISQMEKAITWPMRYVPHPMFRLIVLTVSITRARNGSVNQLCKDMGWPYTTAGHRFNKACNQIADGLERDAVPCWR